ncbi:MAG TPA: discoidin domain-containing protein [Polyangiales bacterium]|nr:discoidin domain-containing protein [Polyangiales bacterium]
MPKRHVSRLSRSLYWSIFLVGLTLTCTSEARARVEAVEESPMPPREAWRASSSAAERPSMAASMAIDGDLTTRWGGAFSANHWVQIDLSAEASVGGLVVHWDSGFAANYRVLTSVDGNDWRTVFETTDGQGGVDYIFFPTVRARYVRLASTPLNAELGVSVFELEPLSASEVPRISGLTKGLDPATVWGGGVTPPRPIGPTRTLTIDLPRALPTTGLEVFWGGAWKSARLESGDQKGNWKALAKDSEPPADSSLLAAREPITATKLRITIGAVPGKPPMIRRLRLLPPDRTMTPQRRYEVAASRTHGALFPLNVRNQQVYWTVVGIPAGRQKSIFDEFGNLEAWKGAPLVQPLWRDSNRVVHAAHGGMPAQTLREGWMPMPSVQWQPEADLTMRSQAIAVEQSGQPVTLVRYRIQNDGKRRISGELFLLVRPMQINPSWQSGGISPIHDVVLEGPPTDTGLRVNDRLLLRSLTPVGSRGTAGFGASGEGELTQWVVWGGLPTALKARDYDGLAAAYLRYPIKLAPGESRGVVIAFPLGTKRFDARTGKLPEAPPIDRDALLGSTSDAAEAFDALASQVAQQWQERVGHVSIVLPDAELVQMMRAQVAYTLINQTGPAMQPGPRNYNRAFIRDGAASAHVLLRMGLASKARDFLRWYADHAVHDNGLVSPILNDDGSVSTGFGSDIEFDAQGQFISLVADVARLDGGAQTVREYLPKVRLALRFLQQLRERTLVPGYKSDHEAPERFRGLIAPSISHEGYSVPTHSYWDDYWALKGWHDGAWLAALWGDAAMETSARAQYALLRESVAASVRATIAWKNSDTIPASADLGDIDPTSVSIALDPCDQQDLLPADALERTFDGYLENMRKRSVPGSQWRFSPYELRNVLSFVRLNRPADAIEVIDSVMRYRRPEGWQMFAEVVDSRLRHTAYVGDMPHTWIGTEYVRAIIGMLMHEADTHIELLPGVQPSWLSTGSGISVADLPTAFGPLTMTARQNGNELRVVLGPGLFSDIPVKVVWPTRERPQQVWVDGQLRTDQTADGIRIERPFRELLAQW